MRKIVLAIALLAFPVLVVAGCGGGGSNATAEAAEKTKPTVTVPTGPPPKKIEIKDLEVGSGEEAKSGDEPTVQYVGVTYKDGREFVSSWRIHEPLTFPLGKNLVIPGWDKAIEGMKVGGRRQLIIPPQLAYGKKGDPPTIPPNETLVYVIDLLAVKSPK
jgi:peptidylprolyl isomerase